MTTHAEKLRSVCCSPGGVGFETAPHTLMEMIPQSEQLATKSDLEVMTGVLSSDIREMRRELKADMAEIRADLRSQTRTFVVTQIASVFGVAGLVVAIQQLL